jgi:anaerobic ribonucleoside-triphosphate reductase activating protein
VLRLSRMHYPVADLGPGRRLAVWVQGCTLGCLGCASPGTWDPAGGDTAQTADALRIWSAVLEAGADGLTVSGGEPLQQAEELADLLDALAAHTAETGRTADVLLYTGYDVEEIAFLGPAAARVVEHADALVTGRFRLDQPTSLLWRGSANQRLIPRTGLGLARYGQFVG